jgi:allophanate hydrolase subunit 2
LGGAFDVLSHRLANALLANRDEDATLELTLLGGTYRAEQPLALALAGAPVEARVETKRGRMTRLNAPQSFSLSHGDRLILGGIARGARTYLAVAGGWQAPVFLGSRSGETPLRPGDRLEARSQRTLVRRPVGIDVLHDAAQAIRVLRTSETRILTEADPWYGRVFRVAPEASRMGLRLDGPELAGDSDPVRLSTPVLPGTVQLAGGTLIILGPACGTMGGYPQVAQVISADLPRLGQLRPNAEVRLEWISLEDARRLDRQARTDWRARLLTLATMVSDEP